jgi:antitoxin ParD1/3/4
MATMNISLPDELKAYVEERVRSGEYANASDFVRDLIRRSESHRRKVAKFHEAIEEGLNSGISDLSFDEIIEQARADAKRRGHAD